MNVTGMNLEEMEEGGALTSGNSVAGQKDADIVKAWGN